MRLRRRLCRGRAVLDRKKIDEGTTGVQPLDRRREQCCRVQDHQLRRRELSAEPERRQGIGYDDLLETGSAMTSLALTLKTPWVAAT